MGTATLLLILAIGGVNFGWQPANDGKTGYEYTVQVEPELVDAMQRGDSIPIESNVPPEVEPIRKVRVVVGRSELPKSPLRHTANFAEQAGWTPDRYGTAPASGSNFNRYAAPAGVNANGVSPPPSVVDRTQTAITETGTAISDGLQAGLRSANEQLSRTGGQVMSDAKNAAQQFGQQLRSASEQTIDATGNQIRQAGNSLRLTGNGASATARGASGVSAPPWPQAAPSDTPQTWPTNPATTRGAAVDGTFSPETTVTRTADGWTTIGNNVAAPPLMNPPLATATDSGANVHMAQGSTSGPSLLAPATSTGRETIHSVLVDPSRQPAVNNDANADWRNPWDANAAATPATIGRASDSARATEAGGNNGLVPVQPRYPSQQNTQQAADRWGDPWANDPWKQQQQQQAGTIPQTAASVADAGQSVSNSGWPLSATNSPPAGANSVASPPAIGQAPVNSAAIGTRTNLNRPGIDLQGNNLAGVNLATSGNGVKQGPPTDQAPWMPLVLVSLSLVGSLSANFYLGLSYLGARQKYVSLVQRTADTFRRAAGAAAAA